MPVWPSIQMRQCGVSFPSGSWSLNCLTVADKWQSIHLKALMLLNNANNAVAERPLIILNSSHL